MPILPGTDDTILLGLLLLFIAAAAALILARRQRSRQAQPRAEPEEKSPEPPARPAPPPASERQVPGTVSERDCDLTGGCDTIQDSLRALAGSYGFGAVTIATADGLVFASDGGENALSDAARFNRNAAGTPPPGMTVFPLDHKGSALTVIIRSSGGISPKLRDRIERDTKDILNWWI